MIKVTHTKTLDGTIEQSQFPNLEAWEQHPYYNNPNFENVVEDITAEVAQKNLNAISLKFLADTDWYVIRQIETNVAVPAGILSERNQARLAIVR